MTPAMSLMKLLANRLSKQACKSLVIRRRPEFSRLKEITRSGTTCFCLLRSMLFLLDSGLRRNDGILRICS
ncbi:hypothetical protein GALL_216860 [mine drainage metagenome]|uniref:Uncharacterized protein n=1 Tax=mine drainage metagenome TaxID=410659 RepID=A0A1J5RWC2_9ZZZZ